MADEVLKRDSNHITVLGGVTDDSNQEIVMLRVDPTTKRLLISATVTATANLIIGTSTITGGTSGKILYNNGGVVGELTNNFLTASGTSSQFIKGDGSLDSNTYLTSLSGAVLTNQSTPQTIGATGARLAMLWVTDITCTNAITGSITGQAGSVSGLTITAGASISGSNTGDQTNITGYSGNMRLVGSSTGYTTFSTANTGATNYTLALPLANDTLVGKATTDSLTNKSIGAGKLTLEENASIALDPAGSADGKYTGITVTGVAGATVAFGDLITLDKDDSRWELVDISVAAAATGDARGILGMAVSAGNDGDTITILLEGIIRADANFPTLTIGANVYASTSGDIVVTQPTTTDYVIRIVGGALTADEIFFRPDYIWWTHT